MVRGKRYFSTYHIQSFSVPVHSGICNQTTSVSPPPPQWAKNFYCQHQPWSAWQYFYLCSRKSYCRCAVGVCYSCMYCTSTVQARHKNSFVQYCRFLNVFGSTPPTSWLWRPTRNRQLCRYGTRPPSQGGDGGLASYQIKIALLEVRGRPTWKHVYKTWVIISTFHMITVYRRVRIRKSIPSCDCNTIIRFLWIMPHPEHPICVRKDRSKSATHLS